MKIYRKCGAAAICMAALVVAGCGTTFESKKIDYKSAGKLPPLEIPPDLTAPSTDERYAVPDVSPQGSATYSVYSKERAGQPQGGSAVLPAQGKAHIERAGTQRWLVVQGTPDQIWPVAKDFWQELGFIIKVENVEAGVMETDWAENRAKIPQDPIRNFLGKVLDTLYSTAERDKFRTRLERGQSGTTEIYISHRGMYEVYVTEGKDQTRWEPRPADPDLEAEMLARLMTRFGVEEARAKSQLTEEGLKRAVLNRDAGGGGSLTLNEAFDRAWRRVGLALDRVGFTVEDRDRSKGLYFVRYADPDVDTKKEDKGFLSKLAFWKSSDSAKAKPEQYRIVVKDAQAGAEVRVLSKDGGPDKSETATRILNLLYEQLK